MKAARSIHAGCMVCDAQGFRIFGRGDHAAKLSQSLLLTGFVLLSSNLLAADTPLTIAKADTKQGADAPSHTARSRAKREIPVAKPVVNSPAPKRDLEKLRGKLSGLWRGRAESKSVEELGKLSTGANAQSAGESERDDSPPLRATVSEVAFVNASGASPVNPSGETAASTQADKAIQKPGGSGSGLPESAQKRKNPATPLATSPLPNESDSALSAGPSEFRRPLTQGPSEEPQKAQINSSSHQGSSGLLGWLLKPSGTNRKTRDDRPIASSSDGFVEGEPHAEDSGESPVPLFSRPASASSGGHVASRETQKGIFKGLFNGKNSESAVEANSSRASATQTESAVDRFPEAEEIVTRTSKAEDDLEEIIRQIHEEYEVRVDRIAATDLKLRSNTRNLNIPRDMESAWYNGIQRNLWQDEERIAVPLREAYARALLNSNQVRVLSYVPLISETSIVEADSQLDPEVFSTGRFSDVNRPTNTTLDTGEIGRFLEDRVEGEAGIRKRTALGGQVSLSNRFTSLENNSRFTIPNPQTSSDLVLSVRQPLLKGGGYNYNKATLKIAKLEAGNAVGEYIKGVEMHLLEVNQAYWGVYLARSAYLLRKSLSEQTEEIVERLDTRSDEATASELLRARSELSKRRTGVTRSEMAVRNAEERLRALINDPLFPIGGTGEFIPVSRPILESPGMDVKGAAREAIANRAEISQSYDRLRASNIVLDAGKREMLPQLDLVGESSLAGIASRRDVSGAYDDMFDQESGWILGVEYSQPWERRFSRARQDKRQYEFLQQVEVVRQTINNVLLEAVVAYRELLTSYRDVQGRYQEVLSTREEINALRERLDVDVNNQQTIAFRLQLIMDALERNQLAEEQFLVSVVSYNIAFAELDRAKGVFLNVQDVDVKRESSEGYLDSLNATTPLTR